MKRLVAVRSLSLFFAILLGYFAFLTISPAQPPSPAAATSWEALGAAEFVEEYRRINKDLPASQRKAAQKQAVALLLKEVAAEDPPLYSLKKLYGIAAPELSADQKAAVAQRLQRVTPGISQQPFRELVSWQTLRSNSQAKNSVSNKKGEAAVIADWIDQHDREDLQESFSQLTWLMRHLDLTYTLRAENLQEGFTVTWDGFVEAPRSGEYTFSPSEFNITTTESSYSIQQSMSVSVDGQQVFDATAEAWQTAGGKIQLTAGQRVPIHVEYHYETSFGKVDNVKLPLAMLYWQGPGISKALVPSSAFSLNEQGKQPGLQATYRFPLSESVVTETLVEPNIEHVWYGGANLVCRHRAAQQKIVNELWRRTMAADYWANPIEPHQRAQPPSNPQHLFISNPALACYLNCTQRAEFLQAILTQPRQLERMTWQQAANVFQCFQYGAEEEAIAFLGNYLQQYDANAEPVMTTDFYRDNRGRYRLLTIPLVWQRPAYAETLEQEYLELEDGSCCLSVAYIVAYGYLQQGTIEGSHSGKIKLWIDQLDEKLADETLTGDRRVNWLVARAMAEEIRRSPPKRHFLGYEELLAGRDWLTEAELVAETDVAQLQIGKEVIARHAMLQHWEAAATELEKHSGALSDWKKQLAQQKTRAQELVEEEAVKSQEAFVAELKRRQQASLERQDQGGADRFQLLIDTATSN